MERNFVYLIPKPIKLLSDSFINIRIPDGGW